MTDKELEKNTQDSVDIAQLFEFSIMLLLLNEFEKVAKGGNQAESTNTIRNQSSKEVDIFKKSLEVGILATLNNVNNSTLEGLKNSKDIKYYDVSKHADNMLENVKKYVKSKGIVLDGQKMETFFYNLCRDEAKAVVEGTTTLEKAMENACRKIGQSGVSVVTYDNTTRKVDVYVRQELLYAQKQSYEDIIFKLAEDEGITVFETDAHPDARLTHQVWHGRRWDITGKLYPTFEQLSHGNGSYRDHGCLHIVKPVEDPTSPPPYTEEQLKNINTPPFEFKGKTYTGTEARERMRYIERQIRACKREKLLIDKKELDNTKISQRLKNWQTEYRQFCKAYGTYPRTNRTRVYTK